MGSSSFSSDLTKTSGITVLVAAAPRALLSEASVSELSSGRPSGAESNKRPADGAVLISSPMGTVQDQDRSSRRHASLPAVSQPARSSQWTLISLTGGVKMQKSGAFPSKGRGQSSDGSLISERSRSTDRFGGQEQTIALSWIPSDGSSSSLWVEADRQRARRSIAPDKLRGARMTTERVRPLEASQTADPKQLAGENQCEGLAPAEQQLCRLLGQHFRLESYSQTAAADCNETSSSPGELAPLPAPWNVTSLIVSWYPPVINVSWSWSELAIADELRLAKLEDEYQRLVAPLGGASSPGAGPLDESQLNRTLAEGSWPAASGPQVNGEPLVRAIEALRARRLLVSRSLSCFQVTYNIINNRFSISEDYPTYLRLASLDRLAPATEYSLRVVAVYLDKFHVRSERISFFSPSDNESRRFKENTYRPIHRYPDRAESDPRRRVAQVRCEELLIVLVALLFWLATICLFFNKWGKIRMLEPYQPAYREAVAQGVGAGSGTGSAFVASPAAVAAAAAAAAAAAHYHAPSIHGLLAPGAGGPAASASSTGGANSPAGTVASSLAGSLTGPCGGSATAALAAASAALPAAAACLAAAKAGLDSSGSSGKRHLAASGQVRQARHAHSLGSTSAESGFSGQVLTGSPPLSNITSRNQKQIPRLGRNQSVALWGGAAITSNIRQASPIGQFVHLSSGHKTNQSAAMRQSHESSSDKQQVEPARRRQLLRSPFQCSFEAGALVAARHWQRRQQERRLLDGSSSKRHRSLDNPSKNRQQTIASALDSNFPENKRHQLLRDVTKQWQQQTLDCATGLDANRAQVSFDEPSPEDAAHKQHLAISDQVQQSAANKLRRMLFLSKSHRHHHLATSISSSTLTANVAAELHQPSSGGHSVQQVDTQEQENTIRQSSSLDECQGPLEVRLTSSGGSVMPIQLDSKLESDEVLLTPTVSRHHILIEPPSPPNRRQPITRGQSMGNNNYMASSPVEAPERSRSESPRFDHANETPPKSTVCRPDRPEIWCLDDKDEPVIVERDLLEADDYQVEDAFTKLAKYQRQQKQLRHHQSFCCSSRLHSNCGKHSHAPSSWFGQPSRHRASTGSQQQPNLRRQILEWSLAGHRLASSERSLLQLRLGPASWLTEESASWRHPLAAGDTNRRSQWLSSGQRDTVASRQGRVGSVFAGQPSGSGHRDSFAMLHALSQKRCKSAEDVAYLSSIVLQIWAHDVTNPLLQSASSRGELEPGQRRPAGAGSQRRPKSSLTVAHI